MKRVIHEAHKPSGVDWIGEVPSYWDIPSLGMRYTVELGKMLDDSRITGDHLVSYLRNVDVQWDCINSADLPQMDIGPHERNRFTVRLGDLLVCEGGEIGRAAIVDRNVEGLGYQKALHRLRPKQATEYPRFQYYSLLAAAEVGAFVADGNPNTIPHLTAVKLRRHRMPFPPAEEQRVIADFLDRETARLDTLVGKKRELIEKLKEKRTALISRTVTRGLPAAAAAQAGLNTQPKLKPSGIEWLGDIPEHWEVKRFRANNSPRPRLESER